MILVEIPQSVRTLYAELTVLEKKKIWKRAKIFLLPGQAKVAPPVSSVLGQFGINLLHFCEKFNSDSKLLDQEIPVSVSVLVFSDKTFRFKIRPVSLNELCFSLGFHESLDLLDLFSPLVHKRDSFMLSFYKLYLVSASSNSTEYTNIYLPSRESFYRIKTLISYLRSYKHNHIPVKK